MKLNILMNDPQKKPK